MRNITPFNQWDAKWRDIKLGTSSVTLGSHGCYTTVMACGAANFFKKDIDPGRLADYCNKNGGYDSEGQIMWSIFPKLWPDVKLTGSAYTTNTPGANLAKVQIGAAIERVREQVARGQVVGLCVDLIKNDGVAPDHIVLAVETPAALLDWVILDPDGGRLIKYSDRYGDPQKTMMGYRILGGTPADFPEYSTDSDKVAGIAIGQLIDQRYSKAQVLEALI